MALTGGFSPATTADNNTSHKSTWLHLSIRPSLLGKNPHQSNITSPVCSVQSQMEIFLIVLLDIIRVIFSDSTRSETQQLYN